MVVRVDIWSFAKQPSLVLNNVSKKYIAAHQICICTKFHVRLSKLYRNKLGNSNRPITKKRILLKEGFHEILLIIEILSKWIKKGKG